jgi:hypothetical protein
MNDTEDNEKKGTGLPTDILKMLADIGKPLAESVAKHSLLAALLLCLIITAAVTIYYNSEMALSSFYKIAVLVVIGVIVYIVILGILGVISQRREIAKHLGGEAEGIRNKPDIAFADIGAKQSKKILLALNGAADDTAKLLGIAPALVRSNVFGENSGRLRIVDGLTYNMHKEDELSISMPIGYGSTGRCFKSCGANIARFLGGWGQDDIEEDELRKAHLDLRWIISVPIMGSQNMPVGVLNVDGLKEVPELSRLEKALVGIMRWSATISIAIVQGE